MADKAVDAVKKSVSSFWKYASGYATQMFTEEDLESEAIMIGDDKVRKTSAEFSEGGMYI